MSYSVAVTPKSAPQSIAIDELFGDFADTHHYRLPTDPDDTLSFVRAAATGRPPRFFGQKHVTDLPNLPQNCPAFYGVGRAASEIVITTPNGQGLGIAPYANKIDVGGFTLTRQPKAVAGADGIITQTSIGRANFFDMVIEKQWRGMVLCPTDDSTIERVATLMCESDGAELKNTALSGALQWSFNAFTSSKNGGRGLVVRAMAGPAAISLGDWDNIRAYANTENAVAALGLPAVPIHAIRWDGGFVGDSGGSNVLLDTYGFGHDLTQVTSELAGRGYTGPNMTTAPTMVGAGFEITPNNVDVDFGRCIGDGNSWEAYILAAGRQELANCKGYNNGAALVAGRRSGILHLAGHATIDGGAYYNRWGGVSQQHGLAGYDGKFCKIFGGYWTPNALAPTTFVLNPLWAAQGFNTPMSMDTIIPAGGVLVGSQATGGVVAPNVINVAGGITKNGVGYVNP